MLRAGPRLPEPVAFAAYFVASEALANVAKYAQATAATVRVVRTGTDAVIEITDDGVGGADPARGSGLRGLADRVEALGGRLRVSSPAGGGTVVTAELPAAGRHPYELRGCRPAQPRRKASTASTRRLSSAPWCRPSLVNTPRT